MGSKLLPSFLAAMSLATIDAALNNIKKSGRHVDALVNNAGVLHEKPATN